MNREASPTAGGRLRRFRSQRRRASALICLASFMQSFLLGASVVVGDLTLKVLPAKDGGQNWNGLYAVVTSVAISFAVGIEMIKFLFVRYPRRKKLISCMCIMCNPGGYAVSGAAVSSHNVYLLYVGAYIQLPATRGDEDELPFTRSGSRAAAECEHANSIARKGIL